MRVLWCVRAKRPHDGPAPVWGGFTTTCPGAAGLDHGWMCGCESLSPAPQEGLRVWVLGTLCRPTLHARRAGDGPVTPTRHPALHAACIPWNGFSRIFSPRSIIVHGAPSLQCILKNASCTHVLPRVPCAAGIAAWPHRRTDCIRHPLALQWPANCLNATLRSYPRCVLVATHPEAQLPAAEPLATDCTCLGDMRTRVRTVLCIT